MPRKGKRVRVGKGVYRDGSGLAAVVCVGTRRRELRFPPDTPLLEIRAAVDQVRAQLRATAPTRSRGTLAVDATRYEKQIKDTISWREAMAEVRAWLALYGTWRRSRITREQVRIARAQWLEAGKAWKTVNNRVWRLGHLYHVLDGDEAATPVDGLKPLCGPRAVARRVSVDVVNTVEANLRAQEARGLLRSQKSRARFLVLAATGRRPSELMRARPEDVDLEQRVWTVRDGKGGWSPGCYLTDDAVVAWRLFIQADAWGLYETSSLARVLRAAGWPAGVRPYSLRHTLGQTLSEAGVDLADVGTALGHTRIQTTRSHYVPVLGSRVAAAMGRLDGRFGWGQEGEIMAPYRGTEGKAKRVSSSR